MTYWPELAYLLLAARAIPPPARRARRTLRRWGKATATRARWVGPVTRRWPGAARGAARWCGGHLVHPAARLAGRVARRVGVWCWRRVEPAGRDAAGWLVHTAPGLAGRALLRLAARTPGAAARLVRHAVVGLVWLLVRLARYCLAYPEYAGILREARDIDRPRRARATIVAWRRAATRRSTTTVLLTLGSGLGLWWLHHTHGAPAVLALVLGLLGALAGVGRAVRPLPDPEPGQDPTEPGPDEPYPIADAHTRAEAADCLRRALTAQGTVLRLTGEARRTRWGWETAVILRAGIPAGIIAKTAELETHLDLPAGGLLVTPDRTRRARVVLRLVERDPFTGLGPPPARTPATASITDRAIIGQRIDDTPLAVPLLGVHAVIIGTSGAGKSTTLRTLADALTACRDALVWDLDPAGCGLDALGPALSRRERDPAGITGALTDALAIAQARPRMLADLDMGPAWQPSPDRPALVLVIDEYPRLPDKAKALAVALLRVGRKARVTLILAATEATSDTLGAAIADTTALAILHPCRHTDVRLVLGPQMLADGWRPDRLHPATADDPGDAGRAYVATTGHREPLLAAIHPLTDTDAAERGAQHAAAELPTSITNPGQPPARPEPRSPGPGQRTRPTPAPPPTAWRPPTTTTAPHSCTRSPCSACSVTMIDSGITPSQIWRHGRNRRGYLRADLARAVGDDTSGSGS